MKTPTRSTLVRPLASLCLLALAAGGATACGDSPTPTDAGDVATDMNSQSDASDASDPQDASDAGETDGEVPDGGADSGPDAGASELRLVPLPLSPTGHDRLLGVTFDTAGNGYATGLVSDGTDAMADFRTVVVKFNPAGEVDTSFGTMGVATHNIVAGRNGEIARGIVVQPSGKIVVAATVEHAGAADPRDRDVALVRFNANGTVDTSFGTMGVVTLDLSTGEAAGRGFVADMAWGLTAYSDGRLLLSAAQKRAGGSDSDFAVVRLSADGVRDATFGTDGVATVDINNRNANPRTVTILADGSILGAGYFDDGGVIKPVLFKLTAAGRLDEGFATRGVFAPTVLAAITEAYAAIVQGTSFVTAGYGRGAAPETLDWVSLRVTATGMLDTTYGMSGVARVDLAGFNDNARDLAALPDGRILIVGGGRPVENNVDAMVSVLTANGQRDATFGTNGVRTFDLGGPSDFFWGVAVSPMHTHALVVGNRGFGMAAGNDDAAVLVVPLSH